VIRLVQLGNGSSRCVALVDEPNLRCLSGVESIYDLARQCIDDRTSLSDRVNQVATGEVLSYDDVYDLRSAWRLLSPIDVPGAAQRVLVSGTGLTHLGSAKDRQAMHKQATTVPVTDSMRMFEAGLEGGRPKDGEIGAAPEWFYKGNGSILQAPFAPLTVPAHAEDGGEEAEVAGVYLIDAGGMPVRVGMCLGNEFSDHAYERRNYLHLAGSKLRTCSIGPELVIDGDFRDVEGGASIERAGRVVWRKAIETGEKNMSHSLANLEHHHFKFDGHRTAGDVHVHFYGAHSLSFGEGVTLEHGDWMQVAFEGFGRALRNPLRIESRAGAKPIQVQILK
jgi:hypothetical protein